MTQSERDLIIARIAQSYLVEGKHEKAFQHASLISDRYGTEIPISGWVAGIASWQQRNYTMAGQYFQRTAGSKYATSVMVAASSYWAARSFEKMQNKDKTDQWLQKAASFPTSFYGILARKKLGKKHEFNWKVPTFIDRDRQLILSTPRGQRAYYLAYLGLNNLATMELEGIDPSNNPALEKALYAFASDRKLSRFLYKFGHSFTPENAQHYDAALYPDISAWQSLKSPKIDKALIHALVRQESRFKANAQSSSGALGLMQLLPSTAAYIMKKPKFETTQKSKLFDPKINMNVGDTYVDTLLNTKGVGNNLFSMLIAYNAGPGTLARWQNRIKIASSDPLLFIELIPSAETRSFIEHVMENLWIYRDKFGQEAPSLEAIIHDVIPPYRTLDN
jgi:soluble lytic murein transglycosylase-like protein